MTHKEYNQIVWGLYRGCSSFLHPPRLLGGDSTYWAVRPAVQTVFRSDARLAI